MFSFPISLLVIKALFESILELIMVVSFLVPAGGISRGGKDKVSGKQIRQLLKVVDQMITILEYQHHLDLVDVESKDANVKIALR